MKKYLIIMVGIICNFANAQTAYPPAPPSAGVVTNIEYFIDNNPVFGSGTALPGLVSSGNISSFNSTINLTGLPAGFHRVYFRSKDADGKWSLSTNAFFDNYTVPIYNSGSLAAGNMVSMEYFIDNNDLGFGNCSPIAITPATDISNLNANINVTGIPQGVHRLFIRSKDAGGKWSLTNFSIFDNAASRPYPTASAPAPNIVQVEYFLDNNDAGFGNCMQVPVSSNANIVGLNANINIAGLVQGIHRLFIRSKDANGKWSLSNFSVFDNSSVQAYPGAPVTAPAISNMEYFIDTDPGFGNATPITVPVNSGDLSGYSINLNLSGSLSDGIHYLCIRSKQNPWSLTNIVPFSASGTLPLTWSFVKAQLINNKTLVSWATIQESNTRKFDIEHSTDGSTFIKIGEVAAAGNSTAVRNYSFTHAQPAAGFNYYRIRQTDLDGKYTYSAIATVLNKDQVKQTLVAPNPVKDILHIVETNNVFVKTVEIYSATGSLVMHKTINNNVQVYSMPVGHITSGHYVLKVNYNNESKTYQFIKE